MIVILIILEIVIFSKEPHTPDLLAIRCSRLLDR